MKSKIASILTTIFPQKTLNYFLPRNIILYGHIVSNNPSLIIRNRFRYPSIQELNEFIIFFKNIGYEFVSYREYLKKDNRKKILLTFDDGYKEIYTELHPYMQNNNVPYMIFILTEPLKNSNFVLNVLEEYKEKSLRYHLNREEVLELKSQNVAIGFHTRTHFEIKDNTKLDDNNFLREITIDEKYRNLFSEPLAFAYPFKAPPNYQRFDDILKRLGFKNIFDTGGLKNSIDNHFFRIPIDVEKDINCENCIFYSLKRSVISNLIRKFKDRFKNEGDYI